MANARKGFFSFPFFSSRVKIDVLSRIDRDEIIRLFERRSPVKQRVLGEEEWRRREEERGSSTSVRVDFPFAPIPLDFLNIHGRKLVFVSSLSRNVSCLSAHRPA